MKSTPLLIALALSLLPVAAVADGSSLTEEQKAQLEALRAEVAGQIQLQAFDLVDELVFGWIEQSIFQAETPVVLADVSVPVGYGTGLEALIENHFAELLVKNPRTRMVLTHCPQCTALVVHSGKEGTIVARGVDQPEALAKAGGLSGARHAIFLDFEAEGSALVLRARVTSLEPSLPIVHARTISTSTSSPALLRSPDNLKSAADARREYMDALAGRGPVTVPIRMGVRTYAASDSGGSPLTSIPFIWLQVGAEIALTQARAWTASFSLGATYMPQLQSGWLAQARISRLLSGSTSSLTHPDLYMFFGGSIVTIRGVGASTFLSELPNVESIIASVTDINDISTTFGAFQLGLELRVKNRVGFGVFLESLPTLDSPSVGNYLDFDFPIQSFGAEVTFCF